MHAENAKPLSQITVLDMTVNVPGPFCSTILCDLGARIIKVEPPGGDPLRHSTGIWDSINRGKDSIVLDLKTEGGQRVLHELTKKTDIVLEGWRPGVASRLAASYDILSKINQSLVYCSISGFGQTGPWRERSGHDVNYLSLSGYMGLQSSIEGRPWPPAVLFSDLVSGLYAAITTLASVAGRGVTGKGTYIDLSMTDAALSLLGLEVGRMTDPAESKLSPNVTFIPHYGLFQCADDKWLSLGIVHENHFWDRFCLVAGLDRFSGMDFDHRLRKAGSIKSELEEVFRTRTSAEWECVLVEADIPASIVIELDDIFEIEQFRHREIFNYIGGQTFLGQPARFSTGRMGPTKASPRLGEQTHLLLSELDYTPEEVDKLTRDKVFGSSEDTL